MKFWPAASLLLTLVNASTTLINEEGNETVSEARANGFWYANLDHTGNARGYAPDLENDREYPVFMAVRPGDDGAGIQRAINAGSNNNNETRHPQWLASQPRVCVSLSLRLFTRKENKLKRLETGCLYTTGYIFH